MSAITETDAILCSPPHGRAPHETEEARVRYAGQVRAAGIRTALLRLREGRPASALRAMAEAVEDELAIEGLSGCHITCAPSMVRLTAAHRGAEVTIPRRFELVAL